MKKPTQRHCFALIRSIHLLEHGLLKTFEQKFHKSLEMDIRLLGEVRAMLFEIMENPTLPFTSFPGSNDEPLLNPIGEEPDEAI